MLSNCAECRARRKEEDGIGARSFPSKRWEIKIYISMIKEIYDFS
jgi:hypothetical protein